MNFGMLTEQLFHRNSFDKIKDVLWLFKLPILCICIAIIAIIIAMTVYTLLNADSNRTFLACVLMIDSVMPFRSGSAHGGH